MRIVSLVPSLTELLYHLNLNQEVVGITKFCIHPEKWFREKTRIGGTKTVNVQQVLSLNPDLIIANKEENTKEQILELQAHANVLLTDINSVEDALSAILHIGDLTNRKPEAQDLSQHISKELTAIKHLEWANGKRVLYLIWKAPYMAAGTKTFIHELLNWVGFKNVLESNTLAKDLSRYPEISDEEIRELNPDIIFLSSEPYPFKKKHIEELHQTVPKAHIQLVDGEVFSWYGSRLKFTSAHVNALAERIRYI